MKNIVIFIIIFCSIYDINSQISLSPNPSKRAICPNTVNIFTVSGLAANCSGFSFELTEGEGS